jgi:hypothetical protein
MTEHMITLRLTRNQVGQILDGLRYRQETYQKTANCLNDPPNADPLFVIEEVRDAEEAENMVRIYGDIIQVMKKQMTSL